MSRTMQDIQNEYQRAALELGGETYKVYALGLEVSESELKIAQLQNKMVHLNKEANTLTQKQQTEATVLTKEVLDETTNS